MMSVSSLLFSLLCLNILFALMTVSTPVILVGCTRLNFLFVSVRLLSVGNGYAYCRVFYRFLRWWWEILREPGVHMLHAAL